jgi:hypothetical protein
MSPDGQNRFLRWLDDGTGDRLLGLLILVLVPIAIAGFIYAVHWDATHQPAPTRSPSTTEVPH